MITYLLIAIVTVLFYKFACSDFPKAPRWACSILFGIFIGGMISLVFQMPIRFEHHKYTKLSEDTYSIPIVSLKNRSDISGSFILGTGSIGSTEYYVYFKQYEDGGIKRDRKPSYLVTLHERDEQPKLEWTEITEKAPWYVRFGFDYLDVNTRRYGDYRLIIPKGTVLLKFEIN